MKVEIFVKYFFKLSVLRCCEMPKHRLCLWTSWDAQVLLSGELTFQKWIQLIEGIEPWKWKPIITEWTFPRITYLPLPTTQVVNVMSLIDWRRELKLRWNYDLSLNISITVKHCLCVKSHLLFFLLHCCLSICWYFY